MRSRPSCRRPHSHCSAGQNLPHDRTGHLELACLYLPFMIAIGFVPLSKYHDDYHNHDSDNDHEEQSSTNDNQQGVPPNEIGLIGVCVSRFAVTGLELSCGLQHHPIVSDYQHTIHILSKISSEYNTIVLAILTSCST